jgi:hypothetical protein
MGAACLDGSNRAACLAFDSIDHARYVSYVRREAEMMMR